MALERTPDMGGLSPAERAALYKQRAAAAGIGKPPNQAGAQAAAAQPAVAAPAPAAAAARREQVAAVARREPAPSAAEQAERLVYVWPHLVLIEFLSAILLLLSLLVVSIILQAPLEGHA